MELKFEDILPQLASTYQRGVLVPFIGSGMSRPACTSWLDFLRKLAGEAGVEVPDALKYPGPGDKVDSAKLYRLADKAVLGLASLDAEARAEAYRRALSEGGKPAGQCDIPEQTQALARCYWPLVLTTNYDDLYLVSRTRQSRPAELAGVSRTGSAAMQGLEDETDIPEVLGRSVEDCHKVIRSLDAPTRPILWALQGFLGGQAEGPQALISNAVRRRELAGQVVAGHQQYQHAINAQPHFRRAFAEVFYRRSLLFLGSGLLEDYLLNLFGEIAHHYGRGPYPHFALFTENKREEIDPQFLQLRLGITPIFYRKQSELPTLLGKLTSAVWEPAAAPAAPRPTAWMPDELGFSLADGFRAPGGKGPRLRLRYAPLTLPADKSECVILSVGRKPDNKPSHGRQAKELLKAAEAAGCVDQTGEEFWTELDSPPSYTYRFGATPIFGVAARLKDWPPSRAAHADDPVDERDLAVISPAVQQGLEAASRAGFSHVRMGPIASGQYRLWSPVHSFVQTLAGIRQFFESSHSTNIKLLDLHVFSPSVWLSVVAGKIPVAELLSSRVMKIWVDVRDPGGASEIFAATACSPLSVAELRNLCGLDSARWEAELIPRPNRFDVPDRDNLLVTPGSTVVFSPKP